MIPQHRPTRLPVFLASTLSKIYALGINRQNRKYDQGRSVTRFDRPVISIGNLSTGGTGKTPLVQYVVRTLLDAGHHPAIAMRGYKSKPGQPSDEQQEHQDAFPAVPIIAQPNRTQGLKELLSTDAGKQVDSIILDDGFQHRQIARDLDIVLIDATRPPTTDALLPLGHLREQPASLARAHAIVITRSQHIEQHQLGDLRRWIQSTAPKATIAVTNHTWAQLDSYEPGAGDPTNASVESITSLPIAILTAIGNPGALTAMATSAGAQIVHRLDRPDHDTFPDSILDKFLRQAESFGASAILTTSKDWTKLKSRMISQDSLNTLPILVPHLGLDFTAGQAEFDAHCRQLF